MNPARRLWPLAAALLVFVVTCSLVYEKSSALTANSFPYPLDDAYIHMAMAKNLSQHGVWGVTRYEFSSASSSPLWTLTLALAFVLAGVREVLPFVLAFAACCALLAYLDHCLRRYGFPGAARLFILLLILFCAPLPMLAFSGMEHALHALLTMVFVSAFCRYAIMPDPPTPAFLYAAAALLCLARYEGLFLVAVACCLLAARRRITAALLTGCAAALPLLVFALISLRFGSYPVPNSVLLKGMLQPGMSLGGWARFSFLFAIEAPKAPHILLLIGVSTILLAALVDHERSIWNAPTLSILLFLGTVLLHLEFARVGWLYRYEAYLVVLGIYVCALGLRSLSHFSAPSWKRPAAATFCAVLAICFVYAYADRAFGSLWLIPHAAKNIYDMQYQTALFIRDHYTGRTVVLHDIGAVAFLTDTPIIDVYGLGTTAVAKARHQGIFTSQWIDRYARSRNAAIAVTYPTWMSLDAPPSSWKDAGSWRIQDNQICWSDSMHFYAIAPTELAKLRRILRSGAPRRPPGVRTGLTAID